MRSMCPSARSTMSPRSSPTSTCARAGWWAASTTRASVNSRRWRFPTSSSAGSTPRSAGRRCSAIIAMPCIALVHGAAIGSGVELATACDFIVATPDVTFRTPEAQRGTVGATQRLPRILGKRLAKDMMFTGRPLTAEEARAAGFVARIVSALEVAKKEIAEAIVKAPPPALRLGKRAIDRGIELDPKGAREAEIEAIAEQLASGQWMGKT